MNTPACIEAGTALQSVFRSCGFVFDAAGTPSLPPAVSQADVLLCMCTPSTYAIFQAAVVAGCMPNAAASSVLNPLVAACAAGTGTGTGTGVVATGTPANCPQILDSGINRITSCGVTFDAAANPLQTASTDRALICICTESTLTVFKTAQRTCSYDGFQKLLQVCESGFSFESATPASSEASAGGSVVTIGGSTSAVASVAAGSSLGAPRVTGSGSQTAGATTATGTAVAPTKSSGGFFMCVSFGVFAAVGLLI
ncbi:hypothetical protein HDU77_004172 [Chytriomyces hyalinus]|nr:hypothetical protein HDU77_004172 [Chytriomyces hyalinus]